MSDESDIRLLDIPGYFDWSHRKLASGGSEAIIANLDASSIWLTEAQAKNLSEADFEEMYLDVLNQGEASV